MMASEADTRGDLLDHQRDRARVVADTAPLLGHRHAEEALLRESLDRRMRNVGVLIPARGLRRELAARIARARRRGPGPGLRRDRSSSGHRRPRSSGGDLVGASRGRRSGIPAPITAITMPPPGSRSVSSAAASATGYARPSPAHSPSTPANHTSPSTALKALTTCGRDAHAPEHRGQESRIADQVEVVAVDERIGSLVEHRSAPGRACTR